MRVFNLIIIVLVFVLLMCSETFAYTTEHHAINMSRDLANIVAAPVKAIFINGPKDIKQMYHYEVHDREKPEDRHGLLRKIYAVISAPAVETKAIVDGVVSSVTFTGKFFKEFLSIPFCD